MRRIWCVCAVVFLASCSSSSKQQVAPSSQPAEAITDTKIITGKRYRVITDSSELRIVTYPKGRFGHAHVVGGEVLHGQLQLPDNHHDITFKIYLKVADFEVDAPSWRQDEKLDPDLSEKARKGTRMNMLSDKVLNEALYPEIIIEAINASGPFWQPDIEADITLAGTSRRVVVPVAVHSSQDRLEITGQLQILQSDFGIEPFTALGGILGVADKVLIRFRIQAVAE